jgi:hypothetical protein
LLQANYPGLTLTRTCSLTTQLQPLQKRMNLTKTIRKTPVDLNLETAGTTYVDPGNSPKPKYDEEDKWVSAQPLYGGGMRHECSRLYCTT